MSLVCAGPVQVLVGNRLWVGMRSPVPKARQVVNEYV